MNGEEMTSPTYQHRKGAETADQHQQHGQAPLTATTAARRAGPGAERLEGAGYRCAACLSLRRSARLFIASAATWCSA